MLALPFLLGICLRSPWSPPFPLHALALIPFSLAKVWVSPTLTLFSLMIWYSGLTALFLFLLARAAPAYLPTALSVVLRPLFPFRQAQYVPVFPLKPAPFCTLFAGLGSTNKSAIFLLFSSYLTLALSSPPCPLLHLSSYLKLCGRSSRNCLLSPVLSGYNGSPDTRFSWGTTRLMSLPDGERCLRPPQSLVVSLLLSLVSTHVFSRTGGILSHRSSLTHRFPRFPPRNLCSLLHAHCVLSRLRCKEHSLLLGSYLSKIGRIENPSCSACGHSSRTSLISFCTVQPRTLCAAHSLETLCLFTTSGSDPGELPGLWGSMVFRHAPIPRKGSGNQQQQQQQHA